MERSDGVPKEQSECDKFAEIFVKVAGERTREKDIKDGDIKV